MASKLPHGPLRTLLAAWLLVSAGGWAFVIAVAVYAFHVSGPGAVGAVTAARLLPATLAAPLIGGVIDRGDRARVVAIACAAQAACLAAAAVLVLGGASLALVVALALGKLGMGDGGPGVLYAIWGAGGVIGSAAMLALVRRRGYGLALLVGAFTFAVGLGVAGADGVPLALAAMILAGLGFALVETAVTGLVPRLADDAVVGRVYALSEVAYAGAAGVGAAIAPLLIDAFGAAGSLTVVGAAFAGGAVLAWRSCGRVDVGQEQSGRVRELLRGVSFLAPLPLARLERLVRGAREVAVDEGADVIRIGESGHEFFVIERGEVEIVEYGRRQGPGDGFGEIALLHDVPRTATVRAATDLSLWALTRRAFIAAVTSHGDASHLADAVAAEHLERPRSGGSR